MKIVRPNVPTVQSDGGNIGIPTTPKWKQDWIADKRRWATLECKCIVDIVHDRALLIIDKFPGTEVHCGNCGRFSKVLKLSQTKYPALPIPQDPLF